jgi:dephospho-CoA kinase
VKVIGLTGGIGSGKSTVSRRLAQLGAVVIDADRLARALQARGEPVWREIVNQFGWAVLTAAGDLDRRRLGRRVFFDADQRSRLNQIVHPAVRQLLSAKTQQAREQGAQVVVWDVPLLIEGGLYRDVDEVWVVWAEEAQQLERIVGRDRVPRSQAWARIRAQMPLSDKLRWADRVIDNRGTQEALMKAVDRAWRELGIGG